MIINRTNRFKKQFKKYRHDTKVIKKLQQLLHYRIQKQPLPASYHDHKLQGDLQQYRELHLSPDILIIYEYDQHTQEITLAMIGSHSELF